MLGFSIFVILKHSIMSAPSPSKSAMQFGLTLGIALTIVSLAIYVLELYEQQWVNYLSTLVLIVGLVIGIKKRRDQELGGEISYGAALGYGTLITFFAALISATISMCYLAFIDDSFIQFTLEQQEMQMYEQGLPDEQIEMAMSMTSKFMNPLWMGVMAVLMSTIMGFIISLIAAAFLKKQSDPFAEA